MSLADIHYNTKRREDKALRMSDVTQMVRHWQHSHDLEVDGRFGPLTQASVRGGEMGSHLMAWALKYAIIDIGEGETVGNNRSPYLDHVRQRDGTALPWKNYKAPWCAAALSYWYTKAEVTVDSAGLIPWKSSRSSGALNRWLSQVAFTNETPEPGAVIIFKRGVLGRPGHVGIVEWYSAETDTCGTIEGNATKFPSKVMRKVYKEGAWRKRLSGLYSF